MSFPVVYLFQIHSSVVTTHVFSARLVTHVLVHVKVNVNVFTTEFQVSSLKSQTSIIWVLYIKLPLVNCVVYIQYWFPHFTVIVHVCHNVTISVHEIEQVGLFFSLSITLIIGDRSFELYKYHSESQLAKSWISQICFHVYMNLTQLAINWAVHVSIAFVFHEYNITLHSSFAFSARCWKLSHLKSIYACTHIQIGFSVGSHQVQPDNISVYTFISSLSFVASFVFPYSSDTWPAFSVNVLAHTHVAV